MYEGGTRVPLFVRWPAVVKPETICDTTVTSTDFYPTLPRSAQAGSDTPASMLTERAWFLS